MQIEESNPIMKGPKLHGKKIYQRTDGNGKRNDDEKRNRRNLNSNNPRIKFYQTFQN